MQLRAPVLNPGLSAALTMSISNGLVSGSIPRGTNVYADLAFNPNRRADGDLDCWIVNRNEVAVPFDPQPPGSPVGLFDAVFGAMLQNFAGNLNGLVSRIGQVYGVIDPVLGALNQLLNPLAPLLNTTLQMLLPGPAGAILGQLLMSGNPLPLIIMAQSVLSAADKLDVGLAALTQPLVRAQAVDLAQPLLTGILSSTLGVGMVNPAVSIGTSVGAVGFPASGIVGAGSRSGDAPPPRHFLSSKPISSTAWIRACRSSATSRCASARRPMRFSACRNGIRR
jgi:hypothetical protein